MNAHCFGKGCLPSTSGYDDQVSTLFWPYSVPDTYAGPRNNPADSLQASLITHYKLPPMYWLLLLPPLMQKKGSIYDITGS